MATIPLDDPASGELATLDELRSASKALTDKQKKAIRAYAEARARWHQQHFPGITGKDLFNEAVKRVMLGKRKWRLRQVPFDKFMMGVIKSIAGDLGRTAAGKLAEASSSDEASLDEAALIETPGPEELLLEAEEQQQQNQRFEALKTEFANDTKVSAVLEAIIDHEKPHETRERLHLTSLEYNAARRKIVRHLAKLCLSN